MKERESYLESDDDINLVHLLAGHLESLVERITDYKVDAN